MTILRFDEAPSLTSLNLRVLTTRKPATTKATLPEIRAEQRRVAFEPDDQALFHRVCSVPPTPYMPLTAPHILAAPLHLAMRLGAEDVVALLQTAFDAAEQHLGVPQLQATFGTDAKATPL
mgnify:CR=1 FL=1